MLTPLGCWERSLLQIGVHGHIQFGWWQVVRDGVSKIEVMYHHPFDFFSFLVKKMKYNPFKVTAVGLLFIFFLPRHFHVTKPIH